MPEEDSQAPTTTWQEHWFDHQQLVKHVYYDQHIALYYDVGVDNDTTSKYDDFPLRNIQ